MSYLRRLRPNEGDGETTGASGDTKETTNKYAFYGLETNRAAADRSSEAHRVDNQPARDAERTQLGADADEVRPNDPTAYERVGEHVATVLSSAQEAADRLQASAVEEANHIRAEADEYAAKTRAAAEAYAKEWRENAEAEAIAITKEAEERARSLRNAATRAIERRTSLLAESERTDKRLRNLLEVFRSMTERLENLLADETDELRDVDPRVGAEPQPKAEEDLAIALRREPRSSDSRSRRTPKGGG